ncbi:ATP-dependent DNA helicase PIF1-like [Bactrocera tryoni]|uniref:ATP-dependent DNA helicase PIF1-like n=1 Tax=Bactrocera tryoni TaxID=59916 RepID=UPI001A963EBA|nr:ATP-dependent DNA helicase PIF1-like [Bactrocera tryoni]
MGFVTEIIWPNFRRDQVYAEDIPSVRINFGSDGEHVIKKISIQFTAKYSYGIAERRMLPIILSWASTVHKMQGCTVDHAVIYLGSRLFAAGQAYVALSRCRSLDGIRIEELDSSKLTASSILDKIGNSDIGRYDEASWALLPSFSTIMTNNGTYLRSKQAFIIDLIVQCFCVINSFEQHT